MIPTLISRRAVATAAASALLATPLVAQQPPTTSAAPAAETKPAATSVRPQDDFFRYVNGSWLATTKIPADKASYGSFTELRDKSDQALRTIIEEAAAAQGAAPGSDVQKIGDYYRSYMDTARVEQLGLTPLEPELRRIAAITDRAQLGDAFAHLQRMGVRTPVALFVRPDSKKATEYVVTAWQSGLSLPDRDYYLKDGKKFEDARAAFSRYATTLLQAAGRPDAAASAQAVVQLERALAQGQWERAKLRNPEATYNRHSVAQLDTLVPSVNWARYLEAAGVFVAPAVIVGQPDYLRTVNALLGSTPVETWRDYLTVKLLDAYAGELSSQIDDASFAFHGKALQGLESQRPRWQRGVTAVEDAMGEMVGKRYVERNFRPEDKARMEKLVDNLLAAFRQGIDSLEWMSPTTKAASQAKLAKFTVKIGYPDKWRDYSALEVRPGDLVGNTMRANEFGWEFMVDKLGRPIDRTEWGMTPQTVNAYYNPSMNEIVFPAAILQPPFFDPAADDAVNYGAIGGVIGHEISHGFDDQGSQYDGDGNLRNWWSETDAKAFGARAARLAAQYDALSPVEGLHVNGKLTLGENIGDLSGLTVAHQAYAISLGGKPAPVIDGLTGDQRFFMGWARIWRRLDREDALRQQILTDPHSPSEYRTNQVLRNMPEFYAAFGVKPGDAMYLPPAERVKIW